ncbi:MAG TPA: hypothetical protein VFI51_06645 [Bradyrhizobium sp.]|jgi:hypothetical protein|nr:hypothetical protein [Bradyrhizobium sp.]
MGTRPKKVTPLNEPTRETIEGISARLDELAGVVIELEKQIKELQAEMGRQKGPPRRMIKV